MRGLTSTIILVVVLAGLGGYIYYLDSKPEEAADVKPKAFKVAADDIEELQIKVTDGDTSRLQKSADRWALVEPVKADADNTQATNMASNLASLDIQRVVDESPTDLTQYGLNPPKVEVAFRAKGQKDFGRLQIGEKTPTGGDVYAMKPGEKRVFLVSSYVDDTFKRNTFDLRDKVIVKFEREKVDGLELMHGTTTMQFAKKGSEWTIVKPSPMRADYAAVEGLVTSLSSTQMQKFIGDEAGAAQLREYGLDNPSASASVLMGSGRETLLLGKSENAETYGKVASRPAIFVVASTLVSDLAKPLSDFRRKDVFDMRSFNTTRIELTRGTESVNFAKTKDKDGKDVWQSAGKNVDTAKVEDLLIKLSNLRAQTFETGNQPALKTPALTVSASFDTSRMESVAFARAGEQVLASRPEEPDTAKLDPMAFEEAIKALDALK